MERAEEAREGGKMVAATVEAERVGVLVVEAREEGMMVAYGAVVETAVVAWAVVATAVVVRWGVAKVDEMAATAAETAVEAMEEEVREQAPQ